MNKIKLTTKQLFVGALLLCGLMKNLLFFFTEIRIQPFIGKLTLAAILVLSVIAQVSAQGSGWNTTAIDIKEFSFTPSIINLTKDSQTVTVTVRVTDTERDVRRVSVAFKSPTGVNHSYDLGIQDRISGDGRDGVYRKALTFSQYTKKGSWEVSYIDVLDGTTQYYRYRHFFTSDLVARGFATRLEVINNNEEIPPEISDFSFTPSAINKTNGSRNVTIALHAKDDTSGVSSIDVSFSNPAGCIYYDDDCVEFYISITSVNRISGDAKDGVYRVDVNIPQRIPTGIYYASVSASDVVRNFTSLSSAELAGRGYPSQLRIFGKTPFDFDGDGRADLSVFRPSDRVWYLNRSQAGFSATQFGLATDKLTTADFDGDGRTDIAVFRDGTWYWLNSSNGNFNTVQFGQAGDVPVPADFTGDGRAELAVYRGGIWWVLNLSNNQFQTVHFGLPIDEPVTADYDGDGRADYAVYREGAWYLLKSTEGFAAVQFGLATDKPVPADYDGDGKTDIVVFRPSEGNWYVLNGSSNSLQVVNWGLGTDALVPADYDGDGKADVAVYRGGVWYIRQTSSGNNYVNFGLSSDVPTNQAP